MLTAKTKIIDTSQCVQYPYCLPRRPAARLRGAGSLPGDSRGQRPEGRPEGRGDREVPEEAERHLGHPRNARRHRGARALASRPNSGRIRRGPLRDTRRAHVKRRLGFGARLDRGHRDTCMKSAGAGSHDLTGNPAPTSSPPSGRWRSCSVYPSALLSLRLFR